MKVEIKAVYHYASLDTLFKLLKGIRNNNIVFYATRITELNDTSEFIYGFKKLWDYLPQIESELSIDDDLYRLSKLAEKDNTISNVEVPQMLANELAQSRYAPYVVCFSEHKDALPMWNMYANRGYGVSLGFKLQTFLTKESSKEQSMWDLSALDLTMPHTLPVIYGDIPKRSNVFRYVKAMYSKYYNEVNKEKDDKKIVLKQLELAKKIGTIVLPKHPAYSYERESRYFCTVEDENQVKFRTNAKGNVIPYIEVEIPTSLFTNIVIGPCREIKDVENVIRMRLKQLGLYKVKIERSRIPYRDF